MQVQNISFKAYNYSNISSHTKPYDFDSVTFSGKEKDEKYLKAQKYANRMKLLRFIAPNSDYNLDKLDGIQTGIKVFDGLTMRDIYFILYNLGTIAVKRGCPNQCLHCFADAKPARKEHAGFINSMPYEDFVELTDGIKELRQRLGPTFTKRWKGYIAMFHDTDCMEIILRDKTGNEHDYTELNDKLYNATNAPIVFDTAGWNHKNPKIQARAEKYVKYLLKNKEKLYQINLSMSPFNPIYTRALELGYDQKNYIADLQKPHEITKGEQLYRIYIDRMANMLFTFTPILEQGMLGLIIRSAENIPDEHMTGHTVNDYYYLRGNVLNRLHQLYMNDLKNEKKVVKSRERLEEFQARYNNILTEKLNTNLSMSGRYKKLFLKKNPKIKKDYFYLTDSRFYKSEKHFWELKKTKHFDVKNIDYARIIDADGKVYLSDDYRIIPTEFALNLGTKDKITPRLEPAIEEDFIITRDMVYKKAGK